MKKLLLLILLILLPLISCNEDNTEIISPNIGVLVSVPGGTFQRDGAATNLSTVSSFKMSKYEITRAQFLAVMGTDPSEPRSSGMSDPVQSVNWYQAIAFCNKLSLLEGLIPVYAVSGVNFSTLTYAQIPTSSDTTWNTVTANWTANGYRLPTEMEWMWAAMGADTANPGSVNTTGYAKAFAGSTGKNAIGDYAVFGFSTSETGHTTTPRPNPVGSKLANELGLYDMSGNVQEWTWDVFESDTYPSGSLSDYVGTASGTPRVNRGGSWKIDAFYATVAHRHFLGPHLQYDLMGFRVVRRP
ncbi:formylglycine-generating enzyme family protein [Myxococcota bacterium]|nr:formylglycine-generating enzyme family protein [Myxococcota bacterium]MBU1410741.1 formylglycine-generating enzyme family protein [Myxococcota bacterium]MBU1510405.1 formylglycine-generating enzyme family protein [Myxococcota bacterium]